MVVLRAGCVVAVVDVVRRVAVAASVVAVAALVVAAAGASAVAVAAASPVAVVAALAPAVVDSVDVAAATTGIVGVAAVVSVAGPNPYKLKLPSVVSCTIPSDPGSRRRATRHARGISAFVVAL